MTSLRVKQIKAKLQGLFEAHLDLTDLKDTDKERETKVLTRCLAALGVYLLTGCKPADAAAAVWDGSDDNGIDAAFFDASESRVILVQSKWIHAGAGEPEAKEIGTFANGVKDIVESETANFADRLQGKLGEISQAILVPGVSVHVVLITTGASEIAKHGTIVLDRVLAELNGNDANDPLATKEVLGLNEVFTGLAKETSPDKIAIDANILEWSYVSTPYGAYFGVVDGLQLKEWWSTHGKRLVAKNIRHALGATDVNNQIRNTAQGEPENFWYFNNGITLIADEALKAPVGAASRSSGIFQFKGASIVNGAQTVSTLGRIESDEQLGRVRVPIRVILLDKAPAGFGGEVTRTNNLQNRIEGRDFVAQDPEQGRLQLEMGIEGIEYQFLRSEDFVSTQSSCELLEVTTALACASGDPSLAVAVKTGIGRFFLDLTKAPYKAIFNPQLSGARAFNATVVQRSVDAWIDKKKKNIAKKSGFRWGVLVHGNRILSAAAFKAIGPSALAQPIADFGTKLAELKLDEKCALAHERISKVLEKDFPGKSLAVLFKSPSSSKAIFDKVTQP